MYAIIALEDRMEMPIREEMGDKAQWELPFYVDYRRHLHHGPEFGAATGSIAGGPVTLAKGDQPTVIAMVGGSEPLQ